MCRHFSRVQLLVTPWTLACLAPLSMGFSRQEYWSGLPCPLPGDLPLCLHSCPANRLISTIFLGSNYVYSKYMIFDFLFLTHFTLYNGLGCIHLIRTDSNVFFFMAEEYSVVCVYHSFFIHSSDDGHMLLPCPGCCKQRCSEHWGTRVSFSSGFLRVPPSSGIVGSCGSSIPSFLRTSL